MIPPIRFEIGRWGDAISRHESQFSMRIFGPRNGLRFGDAGLTEDDLCTLRDQIDDALRRLETHRRCRLAKAHA